MTGSYWHPHQEDKWASHLVSTSAHRTAHPDQHTVAGIPASADFSTTASSSSSSSSFMTSAASNSTPVSPPASVVIDIPASSSLSQPASPASPSHSHPPSASSSSSLERYWPLIAVTIASIYLITLVPFVAPGLFLIQFSLLRYIRHHNDKADAHHNSYNDAQQYGGRRWMRGGERVRRRSWRPPAMAVIVEETEAAVENEQLSGKDKLQPKHTSPLHAHRPPPLLIPLVDMGTVSRPTPLPSSSSPATDPSTVSSPSIVSTPLPAVFPVAQPSSAWNDASQEFGHLLSSSMQMLHVERQMSADNFMAAAAALFVPSLLQPLSTHSLMTPASPCSSSSFSPRVFSVASTASTEYERSTSSSSYTHSPSMSDETTLTPQHRDMTKRFSFDSLDDSDSELSVVLVDRGMERRMDELMCRV